MINRERIVAVARDNPDLTAAALAARFGCSKSTVEESLRDAGVRLDRAARAISYIGGSTNGDLKRALSKYRRTA